MDQERIRQETTAIYVERIKNYDLLIALSCEQGEILLGPGYSKLSKNLSKFDPILIAMKQLDRKEEGLKEYVRSKQENGEMLDYEFLDEGQKLLARQAMDKALELRKLTSVNTQLIDNMKKFVNFSIGIVCKVASGKDREALGKSPSILLDMKV